MALLIQWNATDKKDAKPDMDLRRQVVFLNNNNNNNNNNSSSNKTHEQNQAQIANFCQLIMQVGEMAFRKFFDNLFQPETLAQQLALPDNHKILRRLRVRKLISEEQWQIIYPVNKSLVFSSKFDLSLLGVLIKYLCQVKKPWPNGWTGEPNELDKESGAIFMRYQMLRRAFSHTSHLSGAQHALFLRQLRQCATHFGGENVRKFIEQAKQRRGVALSSTEIAYWMDAFGAWHVREEELWDRESDLQMSKEQRSADIPTLKKKLSLREQTRAELVGSSVSAPFHRRATHMKMVAEVSASEWDRWAHVQGGMVEEERRILNKHWERLRNEVKVDSIIEHFTSSNLLNAEESNDVLCILKSNEQMDCLLQLLVGKKGNAFDSFLASLRKKYVELHGLLDTDFKKVVDAILASKPDGAPYCNEMLCERYKETYRKWKPILWYRKESTDLLEFMCPLQLLDISGKSVSPDKLLLFNSSNGVFPRCVVVEGEAGTGKSTLAKSLAYQWALNNAFFERNFQLLIFINLKLMASSIKAMITEQLFSENTKFTERQIWDTIEENQSKVLFVFDGYENNINDDVRNIIFGASLPEATVMVFSHAIFTSRLQDQYDAKFIVTGFAKNCAEDFVQRYAKLAKKPIEIFNGLLKKIRAKKEDDFNKMIEILQKSNTVLSKEESQLSMLSDDTKQDLSTAQNSNKYGATSGGMPPDEGSSDEGGSTSKMHRLNTLRHYVQIPIYCAYFCAMMDLKLSIDLSTWIAINDNFLTAIKMKLIERERESRYAVNKAYTQLTEIALDTMKKGTATTFINEKDDQLLISFGILQEAPDLSKDGEGGGVDTKRYFFENRLIQEYLAARCIDTSGMDEAVRYLQNTPFNRSNHTTVVFYCGLRRGDTDTAAVRTLLEKLVEYNLHRRQLGNSKLKREADDDEEKSVVTGNIMDFQLSLECIALMEGKTDLTSSIAKTLPERMLVQYKGMIPILTLQGLSYVIKTETNRITQIDIQLNYLSRQTPDIYMRLAEAITQSRQIGVLRIYWAQRDLMTNFLTNVCSQNSSMHKIQCIDETNNKQINNISGSVWKDLRKACRNMDRVKSFAFRNCRYPAFVSAIIRNLPITLEELDLSGCEINIIASQDLCDKLIKSKQLRSLVLSDIKIEGMAFNNFIKAFCSNRSIISMELSGVKLDNVCFFALSEALKVNHKLERLDLRRSVLTTRSCEELAQIMKINTTLHRLQVTGDKVTPEGRKILRNSAKQNMLVEGAEDTDTPTYVADELDDIKKFEEE